MSREVCTSNQSQIITVGARHSPLSQAQVQEVFQLLTSHHPDVFFETVFLPTFGDHNIHISLRTLSKCDFFTREVDDLLLTEKCRIAIHSAKDLPEPLPIGIKLVALTHGLDASDSLVLREGEILQTLPPQALIATSSERREQAVKQLRNDFRFIDIRGPIHKRLLSLETGDADGVVIAEAALIRLKLTHLNRVTIPGDTNPFQGKLAIVSRSNDIEMQNLFSVLDSRNL